MVLILSFDPAVVNLGFCALLITKGSFKIVKLATWDISTPGLKWDKTPNHLLASKLKVVLSELDTWQMTNYPNEKIIVLSEFIFKPGSPAIRVGDMIVYHYSAIKGIKVDGKVAPAIKNKLWFSDDLRYEVFAQKYTSAYTANKQHSLANFLWYCKNNIDQLPPAKDISYTGKQDDMADAFMQALAMIRYGKLNFVFDD